MRGLEGVTEGRVRARRTTTGTRAFFLAAKDGAKTGHRATQHRPSSQPEPPAGSPPVEARARMRRSNPRGPNELEADSVAEALFSPENSPIVTASTDFSDRETPEWRQRREKLCRKSARVRKIYVLLLSLQPGRAPRDKQHPLSFHGALLPTYGLGLDSSPDAASSPQGSRRQDSPCERTRTSFGHSVS